MNKAQMIVSLWDAFQLRVTAASYWAAAGLLLPERARGNQRGRLAGRLSGRGQEGIVLIGNCPRASLNLYSMQGMESPFNRRSADDSCHVDRGGSVTPVRWRCSLHGRFNLERHLCARRTLDP
jgi:hypothetical protein